MHGSSISSEPSTHASLSYAEEHDLLAERGATPRHSMTYEPSGRRYSEVENLLGVVYHITYQCRPSNPPVLAAHLPLGDEAGGAVDDVAVESVPNTPSVVPTSCVGGQVFDDMST